MCSITPVSAGKLRRGRRLADAGSGRIVILPLDGALPLRKVDGDGDLGLLTEMAEAAGVDAVLLRWGEARRLAGSIGTNVGMIVRISGGNYAGPEPTYDVLMNSVEACAAIGADAVCAGLKLGSPREAEMLRDVACVAEACERVGVVLLCETWVVTRSGALDLSAESTAWAARSAQELGADMVKVIFPGTCEGMEAVTARCQLPVVVAGGAVTRPAEVLEMAAEAVRGGATGVAVGRNVLAHPEPAVMQLALADLVHGECSLQAARDRIAPAPQPLREGSPS